jgi:hypothetical protein
MADTLNRLAYEGGRLLRLLGSLVSADGGPRVMLRSLGWDLPPGVEDIGLAAIDLTALSAKIDKLEEALSTGVSGLELDARFADVVVELEQAFVHLRAAVAGLSAIGDYLDKTQIKSELLPRLQSLMVTARLGSYSPLGCSCCSCSAWLPSGTSTRTRASIKWNTRERISTGTRSADCSATRSV